jgi:hypothetical protein
MLPATRFPPVGIMLPAQGVGWSDPVEGFERRSLTTGNIPLWISFLWTLV